MAIGMVGAFWVVSMLFVLTPGADWAYAIAAGIRHSTVVPAVVGLLVGHLAATVLVAAGIAAVVTDSPVVLSVMTIVGAAYLVWLGASTLAHPTTVGADHRTVSGSWLRQAGRGAGISSLNPKVFLLFLALLPQFIQPGGAWPPAAQMLLLGLVHTTTCALVYSLVGTSARRVLRARPVVARVVSRFSGVAMVGIGAALLTQQLAA